MVLMHAAAVGTCHGQVISLARRLGCVGARVITID